MGEVNTNVVNKKSQINATISGGAVISASLLSSRIRAQKKTAIPTTSRQEITPDAGYNALSAVTVEPIPNNYGEIIWNGAVMIVK